MINGIFVPAGNLQGSEIIPFVARIETDDERLSNDGVYPGNFDAHATMQASLRTARQTCEDRLTKFSGVWEAILVPGFASPLTLTSRTIVVLCLFVITVVSLGSVIWISVTPAPPSVLRFAWLPFMVASLIFWTILILSLPLGQMVQYLKPSNRQSLRELRTFLHSSCFQIRAGDGVASNRIFSGPSAGLTIFCAFVEAVKNSGKQEFQLPWQESLVSSMSGMVTSVDLRDDGNFARLGNAPEFPYKVSAIWDYTQQYQNTLTLAVFSLEDFTEVRREWSAHTQETLRPVSALNHGYIVSNSEKARLTFLFCDHLRDFLRYLHPWRWRWLAFRGVPVLLTPILAVPILIVGLAVIQYTPPEFTHVCVPTCTLINPGIYSAAISPGQGSTIQIIVGSHGSRGRLTLDVESNFDKTISPNIDGNLGKRFEKTMTQDAVLFYFTLPERPPSGEIAVVVTLSNEAGKYSQAVVFFTSRDTPK